MGSNQLTKPQIIQLMLDNEELLNEAVMEIYGLDEYIRFIANTKFRSTSDVDFEGLYTSGTLDSKNVTAQIDNSVLCELLKDGRIRMISIRRIGSKIHPGETDQIRFACNGRGVIDVYEGFYYSKYNKPVTYEGKEWEDPEPEGKGWSIHKNREYYYSEKIIDHWYYYKRVVN